MREGRKEYVKHFVCVVLCRMIRDLEAANQLKESQGARVVYLDGYQTREGEPQPFIVQKSDGGFLYATTDIAAAKHR